MKAGTTKLILGSQKVPPVGMTKYAWISLIGVSTFLMGCGGTKLTDAARDAGQFLQIGQPQQALDALKNDDSTHGHYLQGVALERLKRYEAAKEQIDQSLAGDANNLTYRAFAMRLKIHAEIKQGKMDAVDEMIKLHEQHPSHPAVSLYTCYAYQARAIQQRQQNQSKEVSKSAAAGADALKTAIAMSASVPELQREILHAAAILRVTDGIVSLVDRLYALANRDIELIRECIAMYALANDFDKAASAAKQLYQKNNRSEQTALIYADALSASPQTLERDREFADLNSQYPRNTEILSKYALYLARSERLTLATKLLNSGIEKEKNTKARQMLIYIAVSIPLESGTVDTAEEQLKLYRKEIADKQLIEYFEARILYLKKQYQPALVKLAGILENQKNDPLGNRALAKEALQWMQRVLDDRELAGKLGNAAQSTRKVGKDLDLKEDEVRVLVPDRSNKNIRFNSSDNQEPDLNTDGLDGNDVNEAGVKGDNT